MPASTITIADFGLLWGPCLRERLPSDILSHWDKKSWLSDGNNKLSRAIGTSNVRFDMGQNVWKYRSGLLLVIVTCSLFSRVFPCIFGSLELYVLLNGWACLLKITISHLYTPELPIGPLKTCSGLELVPRCKPSTYQPIHSLALYRR